MKISVVIAAYEGERFIGEQLASLCRQSRLPDEVLIGDDSGENNRTFEAIETFRRENDVPFELNCFRNQFPLGVNGNFRSLAGKACGDIIFFCDQDDVWLPEKIKRLSQIFEENPLIDAVCCFSFITGSHLEIRPVQEDLELKNAKIYGSDRERLFSAFLSHKISGAGHNIAIRRSLTDKLPRWQVPILYDVWILLSAAAARKLFLVPERLTMHRIHDRNMTIASDSYVGGSSFRRLRAIKRNTEKNAEFERLLTDRRLFLEELERCALAKEVPPENMQKIREAVSYLQQRIEYRKKRFLLRLFPSFSLIRGFFLFASGLKSLLRDVAGI